MKAKELIDRLDRRVRRKFSSSFAPACARWRERLDALPVNARLVTRLNRYHQSSSAREWLHYRLNDLGYDKKNQFTRHYEDWFVRLPRFPLVVERLRKLRLISKDEARKLLRTKK